MTRMLQFAFAASVTFAPVAEAQVWTQPMLPPAMDAARAALDKARFELEGLRLGSLEGLQGLEALQGLEGLSALEPLTPLPPLPGEILGFSYDTYRQQGVSADTLYSRARAALNRGDYREAVRLFQQVSSRYPKAPNAGDALYWEAYARRRVGGDASLRSALRALERMQEQYKEAAARSDAAALALAIRGELARGGDAAAAERIAERAEWAAQPPVPPAPGRPAAAPRPASTPRPPTWPRSRSRTSDEPAPGCPSLEDDERMAALNALLQMDADRAIPVLQRLLERRDACSELLRRRAVFLVAQQKSSESADILLKAARTDPDLEVRRQAVFWMGQVNDERVPDLLKELLQSSTDEELTDRALFALSQHKSPKAAEALRAYAEQTGASDELRAKAIFYLGQKNAPENAAYLRGLYAKLQSDELREKVLFSVSQVKGSDNAAWLLGIAQAANEPMEMRKKALFWAGQMNVALPDLTGLYDKVTDREMKEQLIFVYSQRQKDTGAVDKLMAIAKSDPDKELRKKALFWLSQTKDPRVVKFYEDLISSHPATDARNP